MILDKKIKNNLEPSLFLMDEVEETKIVYEREIERDGILFWVKYVFDPYKIATF